MPVSFADALMAAVLLVEKEDKMEKGLVSVILPVYNVEKYLDRCLESVTKQTYPNLEIILVDDGSGDDSGSICDNWALKDKRIRVIHKENAGAGYARNTGIDSAAGEFVCFFDSDDYIEPNTVEDAVCAMQANRADIVCFGMHRVNSAGEVTSSVIPEGIGPVFEGKAVQEVFLPNLIHKDPRSQAPMKLYASLWSAMFSMELIQRAQWRLVSEREYMSEDVYSLLALYKSVRKVVVLPKAYYYYCENPVSVSRKYVPGRYSLIRKFYLETSKLCEDLGYNREVLHRVSKPYLGYTTAVTKKLVASDESVKEKYRELKSIIGDNVLQRVLAQNKNDKVSVSRRILFGAMRYRLTGVCFLLLWAKRA